MSERLAARILVSALLRRVNDAGGLATVLARGDAQSGAILVLTIDRERNIRLLERVTRLDGSAEMSRVGPSSIDTESAATDYWRRRRAQDDDLWVVELDIADAERFAAETIC